MGRPRVGLTGKQKAFVAEYVANGQNGTQAALMSYNTEDPITAAVIGAENIRKPYVRAEIERALTGKGLTLEKGLDAISEALGAIDDKFMPDHGPRLRAADMVLKLHHAYDSEAERGGNRGESRHTHLHLELSSIPPEVARWVSAFFRSEGRKPGVQDFQSAWSRPPNSKETRLLAPQPVVVEAEKVGIKAGCRTGKQKVKHSKSKS